MCNEIYVPKDAFIVDNKNAEFSEEKMSDETKEKFKKYYYNLKHQGYSEEESYQKTHEKMEEYFDIFMARYHKKYQIDYER